MSEKLKGFLTVLAGIAAVYLAVWAFMAWTYGDVSDLPVYERDEIEWHPPMGG